MTIAVVKVQGYPWAPMLLKELKNASNQAEMERPLKMAGR